MCNLRYFKKKKLKWSKCLSQFHLVFPNCLEILQTKINFFKLCKNSLRTINSAKVPLWRKKEITLFNEGKDIDYWSPSSFHNGPWQRGISPMEHVWSWGLLITKPSPDVIQAWVIWWGNRVTAFVEIYQTFIPCF